METDGEEATWTVVAPRRKRRRPGPIPKTSRVGEGAGEDSFFALSSGDEDNNNVDDNNGNGNNNEIGKSNDDVNSGDEKGDNNSPQTRKESDTDREEDR